MQDARAAISPLVNFASLCVALSPPARLWKACRVACRHDSRPARAVLPRGHRRLRLWAALARFVQSFALARSHASTSDRSQSALRTANGLLYIAEVIEEHAQLAKTVGQRLVFVRRLLLLQRPLAFQLTLSFSLFVRTGRDRSARSALRCRWLAPVLGRSRNPRTRRLVRCAPSRTYSPLNASGNSGRRNHSPGTECTSASQLTQPVSRTVSLVTASRTFRGSGPSSPSSRSPLSHPAPSSSSPTSSPSATFPIAPPRHIRTMDATLAARGGTRTRPATRTRSSMSPPTLRSASGSCPSTSSSRSRRTTTFCLPRVRALHLVFPRKPSLLTRLRSPARRDADAFATLLPFDRTQGDIPCRTCTSARLADSWTA